MPRHLSEMTVEEQEAFEKLHRITVPWRDQQSRRQRAAEIDKAAMATRKRNADAAEARRVQKLIEAEV